MTDTNPKNSRAIVIKKGTTYLTADTYAFAEGIETMSLPAEMCSIGPQVFYNAEIGTILFPEGNPYFTLANDELRENSTGRILVRTGSRLMRFMQTYIPDAFTLWAAIPLHIQFELERSFAAEDSDELSPFEEDFLAEHPQCSASYRTFRMLTQQAGNTALLPQQFSDDLCSFWSRKLIELLPSVVPVKTRKTEDVLAQLAAGFTTCGFLPCMMVQRSGERQMLSLVSDIGKNEFLFRIDGSTIDFFGPFLQNSTFSLKDINYIPPFIKILQQQFVSLYEDYRSYVATLNESYEQSLSITNTLEPLVRSSKKAREAEHLNRVNEIIAAHHATAKVWRNGALISVLIPVKSIMMQTKIRIEFTDKQIESGCRTVERMLEKTK